MWFPPVITSIPEANSSSARRGVIPNPEAEFSPLAMHRSIWRCERMSASRSCTILRPGEPTMSPMNRIFNGRLFFLPLESGQVAQALPFVGTIWQHFIESKERSTSPCVLGPEPHLKGGRPAPALRLFRTGKPARNVHKGRTTRAPWDPVLVHIGFRNVTCVAGHLRKYCSREKRRSHVHAAKPRMVRRLTRPCEKACVFSLDWFLARMFRPWLFAHGGSFVGASFLTVWWTGLLRSCFFPHINPITVTSRLLRLADKDGRIPWLI